MIRRLLTAAAACALLAGAAQVVAPQVAVAQSGASINGDWRGDSTGNVVRVQEQSDGIMVSAVTNNRQGPPTFYGRIGAGQYRFTAPNGQYSTVTMEGPGRMRVSDSNGWTDLFRPLTAAPSAPTAPSRPAAPMPPPVSPALDPAITDALKLADESARDKLAEALEEDEEEEEPEKPERPEAVYVMREMPEGETACVEPVFVGPRNAGGSTWTFDIQLENECGYDVLVRVDTAERNVGETAWRNYSPNGGLLLNAGEPNTPWKGAVPVSLIGFTPFKPTGEGFVWVQRPPKPFTVRSGEPRKEIGFWIIVCRLTDPNTQQRSFLFVEKDRLQDKPKWRCVKGLDRPAITGT